MTPVPDPLASRGGTPVRATFLPFSRPSIGAREKELVLETLESGWITTGPRTVELGHRVAALAGARHGLAVNSATGALHLALAALGVGPGDEVITSTYTFVACVNVIEHVGARPVLVDVEPDTLCLDPRAVERALTAKTRALLPVDYAGHPCDLDAIGELARARGIPVVEDAAHALGASLGGRPVGSLSDVTAFSFYATKNLTTGEGGAAVTDDDALAARMNLLSLHGMDRDAWKRYGDTGSWYYEVTAPGFKYNLSDVLAAIGLAQLERFESMQQRRRELVALYDSLLAAVPEVRRPQVRAGVGARLAPLSGRAGAGAAHLRPRAFHPGAARREHRRLGALHPHPPASLLPGPAGRARRRLPGRRGRLPPRRHPAALPGHDAARRRGRRRRGAQGRRALPALNRRRAARLAGS